MEHEQTARVDDLLTRGRARFTNGDYDGARTLVGAAHALAGDAASPELLRLLGNLAAEFEDLAGGVALLGQALDGFRIADDVAGEVLAAINLAALLQRTGRLRRARTLVSWALGHVAPADAAQRGRVLNVAANVALYQGQPDEALALLNEAAPLLDGRPACWVLLNRATVLGSLARFAEAQTALGDAAACVPPDDVVTAALLAYGRAWHALGQGDHADALAHCQAVLNSASPRQHAYVFYPAQATLGVLTREHGDLDRAARLLTRASTAAQKHGDQALLAGLHWQHALLEQAQGNEQDTAEDLRAALRATRGDGYGWTLLWQPQQVAALCELALTRDFLPVRASWLLHTTLAPWHSAAEATPPANAYAPQQADLTPRGHDVLRLAAHGLRDREIATHLCVSTRTVQNHLANCYGKLGARSRIEAVQWARRERIGDDALAVVVS